MKNYMVFDIGGSSVKHAIISENGEFLEKGSYKSEREDFNIFKENMIDIINAVKKKYNINGIAVSAPGSVNSDTGIIGGTSALPCIHGPNFKKIFGQDLGLNLEIENDANCAALGEVWKGAAKDNNDVLFVVCGTGIGGAIVKNKKIHKGNNLLGGEIGYMILGTKEENGEKKFKMWSEIGSTGGMVKNFADIKSLDEEDVNGKMIFELAQKGDEDAIKVIDEFYFNMALGIYNLQCVYDPEKILIGGAISNREDFLDKINEKIDEIVSNVMIPHSRPIIDRCKFKNDANLLGALFNYLQRNS